MCLLWLTWRFAVDAAAVHGWVGPSGSQWGPTGALMVPLRRVCCGVAWASLLGCGGFLQLADPSESDLDEQQTSFFRERLSLQQSDFIPPDFLPQPVKQQKKVSCPLQLQHAAFQGASEGVSVRVPVN